MSGLAAGGALGTSAGGQTAPGGFELLALGLVATLFHAVLADRFRMALLPNVRQQSVVIGAARQQLVEHVLEINPNVQIVPPRLLTSVIIRAL